MTPTRTADHEQADDRRRRLRPRHVVATLLALLVVTLVSVGLSPIGQRLVENADDATPVTGVDRVDIADSRFVPASIEVPAGTTVTWVWTDGEAHDVVFEDGPASETLSGGTWDRVFDEPGDFRYRCTLHLFMAGRVVVSD